MSRPYCTHARLESDPDDGRGCPSCAVEARYSRAAAYRRTRGVARFLTPYLIVIAALIGLGLVVGAIERVA